MYVLSEATPAVPVDNSEPHARLVYLQLSPTIQKFDNRKLSLLLFQVLPGLKSTAFGLLVPLTPSYSRITQRPQRKLPCWNFQGL